MTLEADAKPAAWNTRDRLLAALLALCTFALFSRARHFDFIEYDDHVYVYRNVHVMAGLTLENLRWVLTAVVVGNWHPLTILTELTLISLFGPSPAVFHLTNVLLHTLNVLLVFAFIRAATGRSWAAFFTAGLWGLHALRVESVLWVSELKDVLCAALWLACTLAYLRYSRHRTFAGYAVIFLLQALALTAKPMAATLPAALLLLDYWPLSRKSTQPSALAWWLRRIAEKLPLLALSVADMIVAVRTQRNYVGPASVRFPMSLRCENALVSVADYLRDTFFPRHLAIFYPHPAFLQHTIPTVQWLGSGVLLLLITAAVLIRLKPQPYLAVGWFWFLGTLVPVLGFFPLGESSHADRYTYIPGIGLMMALVLWISDWALKHRFFRPLVVGGGVALMAISAVAAEFTMGHWQNNHTLFEYARQAVPDNFLAMDVYANELWKAGDSAQAVQLAKKTVELAPGSADAHAVYGLSLQAANRLPEAAEQFQLALNLDVFEDNYWTGKGDVRSLQASQFGEKKDFANQAAYREKAINLYRQALVVNPESITAREHLAVELAAAGQLNQAIEQWQQLVKIAPTYAQAQGDLADALRLKQDLAGAIGHYQLALQNGSKNPDWETSLAYLTATSSLATTRDVEPMVAVAKDAVDQTHGKAPGPLDAYAAALARVGRYDDAITAAQQGIAAANAAHQPSVAEGINKHLSHYLKGQPFIAGAE
jgi:tetratricopeptide (TPR) repeat protein